MMKESTPRLATTSCAAFSAGSLALLALALADISKASVDVATVKLSLATSDLAGTVVLLVTASLASSWAACIFVSHSLLIQIDSPNPDDWESRERSLTGTVASVARC
jgi:hypothetical protein